MPRNITDLDIGTVIDRATKHQKPHRDLNVSADRWTKYGHDRLYLNGDLGFKRTDVYVDLQTADVHVEGRRAARLDDYELTLEAERLVLDLTISRTNYHVEIALLDNPYGPDVPEPRDVDLSEGTSVVTERHECEECGDTFKTAHGLAVHKGMMHADESSTAVATDGGTPEPDADDDRDSPSFGDFLDLNSERTERPTGAAGTVNRVLRECPECGTDQADRWGVGSGDDADAICVCVACDHEWPEARDDVTLFERVGTNLQSRPVTDDVRLVERWGDAQGGWTDPQPLGSLDESALPETMDVEKDRQRCISVRVDLSEGTNLDALRSAARVTDADDDGELRQQTMAVEEQIAQTDDGPVLQRLYTLVPLSETGAWAAATAELRAVAAEHTPSEALDWWVTERGVDHPTTHKQWAEHRGTSRSAVSQHISAVGTPEIDGVDLAEQWGIPSDWLSPRPVGRPDGRDRPETVDLRHVDNGVVVRVDLSEETDLNNLRDVVRAYTEVDPDHCLRIDSEEVVETDDGLVLGRRYAAASLRETLAWAAVTRELWNLARHHSSAETLDYWMLTRGSDYPETQKELADLRGVTPQTVSEHVSAVDDDRV